MDHVTVVGGGFGGLVAAITAAEAGAHVTLHEAHRELGGRGRTADGPYRTNEGPHALYDGGPQWAWLKRRKLLGPLAPIPLREGLRFRFHHQGRLRVLPPLTLYRQAWRRTAPVDQDFLSWASAAVGERAARIAANYTGVATFHHDPGSLSAAFVRERLRRVGKLPPEAHYPKGGWGPLINRMTRYAVDLGVRIETGSRIDALPETRPVVVATSLDSARVLLGDETLAWPSGRTLLLDLAVSARRGDAFVISDLDRPGWIERFTAQDPSLAPQGEQLVQAQIPLAPHEGKADGVARAEHLLDLGFPGWRERMTWTRTAVATGRTGAVDHPGTTWRDRPSIDRGDGVFLVGDQVAAPGLLAEVSFTSAHQAAQLALAGRFAVR
ncbi:Phytoene dehydrogenase-related protein [Streptoalloteichus tenebrarius]|uniref:Phytoene dehydrogenase-related protein n=2 Tax=Streptoalloteichus tenebrarius (strain ATCC 17920 / DSM 40477 / JCM 4838 / CBS 697.72 / NBRC 16177 / NCIMB 11028 / NRRL B-12390 / A12253. 1 / ISP 5477) TaxID=1933 RepID=A0ABT1HQ01_STRSD|nr:Phytoene dehydrogenase-related protein [Streptoalloteichus tenebrarius]